MKLPRVQCNQTPYRLTHAHTPCSNMGHGGWWKVEHHFTQPEQEEKKGTSWFSCRVFIDFSPQSVQQFSLSWSCSHPFGNFLSFLHFGIRSVWFANGCQQSIISRFDPIQRLILSNALSVCGGPEIEN